MHVSEAVGAVLNLPALEFTHCSTNIGGDGARLRVWHETAWAKGTTDTTDERHHVGCSDREIKVYLSGLDLISKVISTDDVCTGGTSLIGGRTSSKDSNTNITTGTRWECDGSANHLVSFTRINAEADRYLDGLIKLCFRDALQDVDGFGRSVKRLPVERLQRICVFLS